MWTVLTAIAILAILGLIIYIDMRKALSMADKDNKTVAFWLNAVFWIFLLA